MNYDLITSPATEKFIKKLKDKPLKRKFKEAFQEIQLNPYEAGEPKRGDLAGVYGYDIYHNRTNYEIAYKIDTDDQGKLILVILAGTREQFYEELKRYIEATKKANNLHKK
ncbi:type II toxin-antitoxin system RelE/ParE family toxin [Priestia megaterium]|uniref:type II toxin-antitoxin system RelE/ParE family toxin n=1 Tax=Priestia megaterium TaxID=1404 RepID=UPI0031FC62A0